MPNSGDASAARLKAKHEAAASALSNLPSMRPRPATCPTLFGQLGFRKTGSHRSKDVERWSQGNIELVINCEPDGFAHSHYITHGPGVCAIAIDVDDAAKTMKRAEALKALHLLSAGRTR